MSNKRKNLDVLSLSSHQRIIRRTPSTNNDNNYATIANPTGNKSPIISTFKREGWILAISYSFDGTYIAIGGWDKQVAVYNTESGELVHMIHNGACVFSVCFSPVNNGLLAVAGGDSTRRCTDNKAVVYSVKDWTVVYNFQSNDLVQSVVFSEDGGKLAFGGLDKIVTVHDMTDGRKVNEYGTGGVVSALAFAPNGSSLVVGTWETNVVRMYDTINNKIINEVTHKEPLISVSFSTDGKKLAVGGGKSLTLYSPASFDVIHSIQWSSVISSTSWSPDGRWLAVGDWESRATIVDVATGKSIRNFKRELSVSVVMFDPTKQCLAIGGHDNKVVLVDATLDTGEHRNSAPDKDPTESNTEATVELDISKRKKRMKKIPRIANVVDVKATLKSDVASLRGKLKEDLNAIFGDVMTVVKTAVTTFNEELKVTVDDLKADIAALRADVACIKEDIKANSGDLKADVTAVKTDVVSVKEDLNANVSDAKAAVKVEIASVKANVESLKLELKEDLKTIASDVKTDFEDQFYDTWKETLCSLRFGSH